MTPMNFAKLTLFFIVLTSVATSQPFSRSHGAASRHSGFEWNARKIGTKRVATISIRKDEERDRRSIPLSDVETSLHKARDIPFDGTRDHHHSHHDPVINPTANHNHHHRHHHGDDVTGEVEWFSHGGGGGGRDRGEDNRGGRRHEGRKRDRNRGEERSEVELRDRFEGDRFESDFNPGKMSFSHARLSEIRMPGGVDTSRLHEILASSGLDLDTDVFRNLTGTVRGNRRNSDDPLGNKKNKKRSKKVKRERRRKRNKGRKNKSKERKKNRNMRKCRHLKGKQKKKCRAEMRAAQETYDFSFIKESISMSGSDACQYHNLEECSRKVGFLGLASESLSEVMKCRYREEFFDCMEEQRMETCDPNFETKGDMKALRTKIRDVIRTTNSCLISEVVEG